MFFALVIKEQTVLLQLTADKLLKWKKQTTTHHGWKMRNPCLKTTKLLFNLLNITACGSTWSFALLLSSSCFAIKADIICKQHVSNELHFNNKKNKTVCMTQCEKVNSPLSPLFAGVEFASPTTMVESNES